jgi:hypothetical protein
MNIDSKKSKTMEWMKHSALGYNKKLDSKFLDDRTPTQLLKLVHPLDRKDFAMALKREGLVTDDEIYQYLIS